MKRLFISFLLYTVLVGQEIQRIFEQGPVCYAAFTESDNVTDLLVTLIGQEKKSLSIAIFYLSDNRIVNALIEAKKRGVHVVIVLDKQCVTKQNMSVLTRLVKERIDVRVYTKQKKEQTRESSGPLMHNKYCIFGYNIHGRQFVWTGSFNFTYAAQRHNKENIIILEHRDIVERYKQNFESLLPQSAPLIKLKKFKRLVKKIYLHD